MKLFSFASKNCKNIEIGVEKEMWAVGTLLNQQAMSARATKAKRNLAPGDYGLLYCNPLHAFTAPFVVVSHADPDRVVTDVWPEPWRLPFKIRPLGDLSKTITKEVAADRWPFLRQRLLANNGQGGVSAAMNITGTTVFVPITITQLDWELVCADLATR